ncbi:B-box-type zinc finger [Trinorchestia longiramus]|nr:B-box-type zinc finger [Trinorchestia longiramus]
MYDIPFDKTIQNVVTLQAHTSAYVDTEKEKKLVFLTRLLELLSQKQFSMNDYCVAHQSYPKCNYEQLRDFLVLPCKRKLQYITSSIDKDQVLTETFDKVQALQQKNVFLLVDEVQIRTTVSFYGGLLSGMAENNRDCKATSILITSSQSEDAGRWIQHHRSRGKSEGFSKKLPLWKRRTENNNFANFPLLHDCVDPSSDYAYKVKIYTSQAIGGNVLIMQVYQLPVNFDLIPAGDQGSADTTRSVPVAQCGNHGSDLDYLCATCGDLACQHCKKDVHAGHKESMTELLPHRGLWKINDEVTAANVLMNLRAGREPVKSTVTSLPSGPLQYLPKLLNELGLKSSIHVSSIVIIDEKKVPFMPSSSVNIAWEHATHVALWPSVSTRGTHQGTFCIFRSSSRIARTDHTEIKNL